MAAGRRGRPGRRARQRTIHSVLSSASANCANLRRKHRSATAPAPDFVDSARSHIHAMPSPLFPVGTLAGPGDKWTAELIETLGAPCCVLRGRSRAMPDFLHSGADPAAARTARCGRRSIDLQPYDRMGAWRQALGEADGRRRGQEAAEHFEHGSSAAYRTLIGAIAQSLVHELAAHLSGVIGRLRSPQT